MSSFQKRRNRNRKNEEIDYLNELRSTVNITTRNIPTRHENIQLENENRKLENENKRIQEENKRMNMLLYTDNTPDSNINQYKIALFSYNFGNYRNELNINLDNPSIYFDKNIDYYFFTDNKTITSTKWKIINDYPKLEGDHIMNSNRWTYKYLRFHTPDILKEYDIIISVDSKHWLLKNINFRSRDINKLFTENNYKLILGKHPWRNSIKQELIKTAYNKLEDERTVINFYKKIENINIKVPLIELGFFIRRNDKETNDFFEYVYSLFNETKLRRDQNFFPYAIHQKDFSKYIKINSIQNIKHFSNQRVIKYTENLLYNNI